MIKEAINFFRTLDKSIRDILSPDTCLICNEKLVSHNNTFTFLCELCNSEFPDPPDPDYILNRFISNIHKDEIAISKAFSLFSVQDNDKMFELIHLFKYNGFRRIGMELGKELGLCIKDANTYKYDFILPVPIHNARKRERGFNQSEIISVSISDVIDAPADFYTLKRTRYTKTQTLLTEDQRKTNVQGVFSVPKNENIQNTYILLVDDVLTTGSTINSAAICLLESGARKVDIATLAIA